MLVVVCVSVLVTARGVPPTKNVTNSFTQRFVTSNLTSNQLEDIKAGYNFSSLKINKKTLELLEPVHVCFTGVSGWTAHARRNYAHQMNGFMKPIAVMLLRRGLYHPDVGVSFQDQNGHSIAVKAFPMIFSNTPVYVKNCSAVVGTKPIILDFDSNIKTNATGCDMGDAHFINYFAPSFYSSFKFIGSVRGYPEIVPRTQRRLRLILNQRHPEGEKGRDIANWNEVITSFTKLGKDLDFDVVVDNFGKMTPFWKQVNAFASSDIVLWHHGAATVNRIWFPPDSLLIETQCPAMYHCMHSVAPYDKTNYLMFTTATIDNLDPNRTEPGCMYGGKAGALRTVVKKKRTITVGRLLELVYAAVTEFRDRQGRGADTDNAFELGIAKLIAAESSWFMSRCLGNVRSLTEGPAGEAADLCKRGRQHLCGVDNTSAISKTKSKKKKKR